MAGVANITVVGNLGRDPETRFTSNGTMNVAMSVAVSRRFTDQSGQLQERTNWFRITAWGKLAESLDKLAQQGALVKGKQVFVNGGFESREYQDKEGNPRTSLDIRAQEVLLLGQRGDSGYTGEPAATQATSSDDLPESSNMDEVPF